MSKSCFLLSGLVHVWVKSPIQVSEVSCQTGLASSLSLSKFWTHRFGDWRTFKKTSYTCRSHWPQISEVTPSSFLNVSFQIGCHVGIVCCCYFGHGRLDQGQGLCHLGAGQEPSRYLAPEFTTTRTYYMDKHEQPWIDSFWGEVEWEISQVSSVQSDPGMQRQTTKAVSRSCEAPEPGASRRHE